MNRTEIKIMNMDNGEFTDYTDYLVNNYKEAQLLDEQLDEATITLKRVNFDFINPLTIVEIKVINEPEAKFTRQFLGRLIADSDYEIERDTSDQSGNGYKSKDGKLKVVYDSNTKRIKQEKTIHYVVANDNAVKVLKASKVITDGEAKAINLSNHEMYLIEMTKILEGFIGDSLTFTNALGNNYLDSWQNLLLMLYFHKKRGGIWLRKRKFGWLLG